MPRMGSSSLNLKGGSPFLRLKTRLSTEVDIELFDKVNVKESRYNLGARHIVYVIKKAEKKWWSRLIKWEGKPPAFIHVDWDKWIDEDDEKVEGNMSFDDRDFSKTNMADEDFDIEDSKGHKEGEETKYEQEHNSSAIEETET